MSKKNDLRDRVGSHVKKLPIEEIKIWAWKTIDRIVVNSIMELVKHLFGG